MFGGTVLVFAKTGYFSRISRYFPARLLQVLFCRTNKPPASTSLTCLQSRSVNFLPDLTECHEEGNQTQYDFPQLKLLITKTLFNCLSLTFLFCSNEAVCWSIFKLHSDPLRQNNFRQNNSSFMSLKGKLLQLLHKHSFYLQLKPIRQRSDRGKSPSGSEFVLLPSFTFFFFYLRGVCLGAAEQQTP